MIISNIDLCNQALEKVTNIPMLYKNIKKVKTIIKKIKSGYEATDNEIKWINLILKSTYGIEETDAYKIYNSKIA